VQPRKCTIGVQFEILAMEVKYHSIGRLDDKIGSRDVGVDYITNDKVRFVFITQYF